MHAPPFTPVPVPPGPLGVAAVARAAAALIDGTGPGFAPHAAADLPAGVAGDIPADLGLVTRTSGTTGAPLDVLIGREALLAAARAGAAALGPPGHWLTTIPVTAIGGILTVVRALLSGAEPIAWPGVGGAAPFTSESFEAAGAEVLRRAATDGVPAYVSLVPTQLARIVRLPAAAATLARFAGVLVGGAAVSRGLRTGAARAGITIVETYGATETCGGVVYDGVPLRGVRLRLDRDRSEAGPVVDVGGVTIAAGYLGQPEATAAAFADGWFRSWDLGSFDGDRLVVLGRSDGVVKVGGSKVSISAVGEILRTDERVLDASVTTRPDPEWGHRLHAHVVPVDESLVGDQAAAALAADLSELVGQQLGRHARPREISVVADLPMTGAGKPALTAPRRT